MKKKERVLILGGGPAGLTAGFELSLKSKYIVSILEQEKTIGGMAKTIEFRNCKFDIGPHHYVTGSKKIEKWWLDLMGNDFLRLKRFTRIYYNKHFFKYPLEVFNVLSGLSIYECFRSFFSYIKIKIAPIKKVSSFEHWVTNRFGSRLYSIFFKTYTEKVWGIKCTDISSDWAAERIQNFSLGKAIFFAFFGRWFKDKRPRTIRSDFYYPKLGSGSLWDRVAARISADKYSNIFLNEKVIEIRHENYLIKSVRTKNGTKVNDYDAEYFISSMPLQEFVLSLKPIPPQDIINSANSLRYRALITANFIVNKKQICNDHWLYVHEKRLKMGRIGNMNNFSKMLVDNENYTALSLEYFTFVDDEFWSKQDDEILSLAKEELCEINFVKMGDILDGFILRESVAYPVYDKKYKKNLSSVLRFLAKFGNLHFVGRNGLHKYSNMDAAMLSAMKAVRKIEKSSMIISKKGEKSINKIDLSQQQQLF